MLRYLKERIGALLAGGEIPEKLKKVNWRLLILAAAVLVMSAVLIVRLFRLQIVSGEDYLTTFKLRIRREIAVPGVRGNIYDRNGKLLAYNELSYSVVIRDEMPDTSGKNDALNQSILNTIRILEDNGAAVSARIQIEIAPDGSYRYTVSDTQLLRFLADVHGRRLIEDLKYEEKTGTADETVAYLADRFGIDTASLDREKVLQVAAIRYLLSNNSFQRYLPTTIASGVDSALVAVIMENSDIMPGVSIEENTLRRYNDAKYFSQIIGYTGKVSTEELAALREQNPAYDASDVVGKAGIEASMEAELFGHKGSRTMYVDNLGRILETAMVVAPSTGNHVYLTIDADLQKMAYDLLEKKISEILLAKIRPIRELELDEDSSSSDIVIPIYDVYYSVIRNNVLDIGHFSEDDAAVTEKAAHAAMLSYREEVLNTIEEELYTYRTPYDQLKKEYKNYETYIVSSLYSSGVLNRDAVDAQDSTYIAWTEEETISLAEFLEHAVASDWVDTSALQLDAEYVRSSEVFDGIWEYIRDKVMTEKEFTKYLYRYMILSDIISGDDICRLLMEQEKVTVPDEEAGAFFSGEESSYDFMCRRIETLDLTPAELNLDPYCGSIVITDPSSGEVLALVSYPSYDNNRMSNGVDAAYFAALQSDRSTPLLNFATQQATAPGSTFKMVTATAGLTEGVITLDDQIYCVGTFAKITPSPHCWIYPNGAHGPLNVTGGIRHSCNEFFYEVGYRLGLTDPEDERSYDSDFGIERIRKYAQMYGLDQKTGLEIDELQSQISGEDAVRSAIGQGTHNITTAALSRYAAAVASKGNLYDLTLVGRVTDAQGRILRESEPVIRNVISMDDVYWEAIRGGMRQVVEDKAYFSDLPVAVAGKTGTAQQTSTRPNHALFVCFAPYEQPTIAVATRVAYGYTSDYAAQITKDVLKYYFHVADRDTLLGDSNSMDSGTIGGD